MGAHVWRADLGKCTAETKSEEGACAGSRIVWEGMSATVTENVAGRVLAWKATAGCGMLRAHRRCRMLRKGGRTELTVEEEVRDRGRLPEPNLVLALTGCDVAMPQMRGPLSCFVGRPKLDTWARAFKASLDRNR